MNSAAQRHSCLCYIQYFLYLNSSWNTQLTINGCWSVVFSQPNKSAINFFTRLAGPAPWGESDVDLSFEIDLIARISLVTNHILLGVLLGIFLKVNILWVNLFLVLVWP